MNQSTKKMLIEMEPEAVKMATSSQAGLQAIVKFFSDNEPGLLFSFIGRVVSESDREADEATLKEMEEDTEMLYRALRVKLEVVGLSMLVASLAEMARSDG